MWAIAVSKRCGRRMATLSPAAIPRSASAEARRFDRCASSRNVSVIGSSPDQSMIAGLSGVLAAGASEQATPILKDFGMSQRKREIRSS
jgi:hypothetical protein